MLCVCVFTLTVRLLGFKQLQEWMSHLFYPSASVCLNPSSGDLVNRKVPMKLPGCTVASVREEGVCETVVTSLNVSVCPSTCPCVR